MNKKICTIILSIVTVCSLSITASAYVKKLTADMSLKQIQSVADKNTYSYKIYEYEKENKDIELDNTEYQLDYYKSLLRTTSKYKSEYYEYKLKIPELNKEVELLKLDQEYYDETKEDDDKLVLDYSLKSKYYDLCLLKKQLDAQNSQVEYLKKSAEIEAVRFENGQSTENACQLAEINLKLAQNQTDSINDSIKQKEREITDFLNQYKDIDDFSVKCEPPNEIEPKKYDAEKLYKHFSENSFELKKLHKSIELDEDYLEETENIYGKDSDTYKSFSNSLETDKLNLEMREQDYLSQILALVSDYENACGKYEVYLEYNAALESKLEILKTAVDTGNISELEYLEQAANICSEQNKLYNALVGVELLGDKLKLVEEGIWFE